MFDVWILTVSLQYIHGLAARGVHYLHRPGPTLQDVGFFLLPVCNCHSRFSLLEKPVHRMIRMPLKFLILVLLLQELGQDKAYISETLFAMIFISFVLVRKESTLPVLCQSFHILTVLLCCVSIYLFTAHLLCDRLYFAYLWHENSWRQFYILLWTFFFGVINSQGKYGLIMNVCYTATLWCFLEVRILNC